MVSIKVKIENKFYPLKVRPEDEEMMYEIADFVNIRLDEYKKALVGQNSQTVLTLACLSIAEELFLERKKTPENSIPSETGERLKQLLSAIKSANSDI